MGGLKCHRMPSPTCVHITYVGVIHILYHALGGLGVSGGALQNTMKIVTQTLKRGEGVLKIGYIGVT